MNTDLVSAAATGVVRPEDGSPNPESGAGSRPAEDSPSPRLTGCRRRAAGFTLAACLWLGALPVLPVPAEPEVVGPMVGHTSHEHAHLWMRPGVAGEVVLEVFCGVDGQQVARLTDDSSEAMDFTVRWRIDGLAADHPYRYRISWDGGRVGQDAELGFRTWPAPEQPSRLVLAFGSCAHSRPTEIYRTMEAKGAQALVLLGDTPYIDNPDREINRAKHRQFLTQPEIASFIARHPTWDTWDDHDFGLNDSHGANTPTRLSNREAFIEYRAQEHFGQQGEGIYTSFRAGGVEVFMLDARYFARTEASPVDPEKLTCLGGRQWNWLLEHLEQSDAPFKILATGQVWFEKANREIDHWHTYRHERDALWAFIEERGIPGVILMGGDIHASRHMIWQGAAGYDLHEFTTSPLHERVIPGLNSPHEFLVWGEAIPEIFLRLTVDTTVEPAVLEADMVTIDGETVYSVRISRDELEPGGE